MGEGTAPAALQPTLRWVPAGAEKQAEAGDVDGALVTESSHPQSLCGGGGL